VVYFLAGQSYKIAKKSKKHLASMALCPALMRLCVVPSAEAKYGHKVALPPFSSEHYVRSMVYTSGFRLFSDTDMPSSLLMPPCYLPAFACAGFFGIRAKKRPPGHAACIPSHIFACPSCLPTDFPARGLWAARHLFDLR